MNWIKLKMSVRKKLMVPSILSMVVFTGLFGIFYFESNHSTEILGQKIVSSSGVVESVYKEAILSQMNMVMFISEDALMGGDTEMLNQTLFGIKKNKAVQSAFFLDAEERIMATGDSWDENPLLGKPIPDTSKLDIDLKKPFFDIQDQTLIYAQPIIVQDEYQGRLQVVFSIEALRDITNGLLTEVEKIAINSKNRILQLTGIGVLTAIIALLAFFYITGSITKVINRMVENLKDIAEGEGDLSRRLEVKSKDEVGQLALWFNTFVTKLETVVMDIAKTADSVNASSARLSDISNLMKSGSEENLVRTTSVSSATEEMSQNMTSVAASMEEASSNVNFVATAAEQLASSIGETADNTNKSRNIARNAVSQIQTATDRVNELGNAAKEISKVSETITEISEQINLLALNATIESARAGEAGRGFAVVANEIKELARSTSIATQEIKNQISGIQLSTAGTIDEIKQITSIIDEVDQVVTMIASAVEEQSVTTKEVSTNVGQVLDAIQNVTEMVSQSTTVAGEIAKDISEINQAENNISNSSSQVNTDVENLFKMADTLKEKMGKFKVGEDILTDSRAV